MLFVFFYQSIDKYIYNVLNYILISYYLFNAIYTGFFVVLIYYYNGIIFNDETAFLNICILNPVLCNKLVFPIKRTHWW